MIYQSPALLGAQSVVLNEAQTLGTVAWLLLHSELHKKLAIGQLATMYIPAIKCGQYILGIENDTAVFYAAWTKLSFEEERTFLTHGPLAITPESWQSGDRVWFMDWVAPFGHSQQAFKHLREQLWTQGLARALYLPPNRTRDMRLIELHSADISPATARQYFESHPIAAPLPKRLEP
jgi:cytolysin-activating lysine-acyltransferase